MKVKIDREEMTKALQEVVSATPSRSTLPILSNLLLECHNEKLKITATDLEICIRKYISAEVLESGKITAPGKKLHDILREVSDEILLLEETKGFGIILRGGKFYVKLLGFSPEEYPDIPDITGREISLNATLLKEMISKTYFACSREETRYVLNGILFDFQMQQLRVVASDGRRLALYQNGLETKFQGKYIIPQKAIVELLRLIEKTETDVIKIKFSEKNNQISFTTPDTELITRLIEGDFPNYEEVIPDRSSNRMKIKTTQFYQAIKRASLLSTAESIAVKLEVTKDKLTVSKITPELGEVREDIDVEYKGEDMVIGFNPQYLLDVLKTIAEEEIDFELNGTDKPGVIRLDSNYIYLVLPMQLV